MNFRKSMREIDEAVPLIGELDQRTENHSVRVIEEESSRSPVHVLRNHRGVLYGNPILFLCISFSFCSTNCYLRPRRFFLMSSHFTLTRLSPRLNCLCRGHWRGGLHGCDGRCIRGA